MANNNTLPPAVAHVKEQLDAQNVSPEAAENAARELGAGFPTKREIDETRENLDSGIVPTRKVNDPGFAPSGPTRKGFDDGFAVGGPTEIHDPGFAPNEQAAPKEPEAQWRRVDMDNTSDRLVYLDEAIRVGAGAEGKVVHDKNGPTEAPNRTAGIASDIVIGR